MKPKTTLILLTVVVVVAVYIKFYESKRPNTAEAKRQSQNVVNFDREKLEGIVIQNGDERVEIRRKENKWRVEAPVQDQADNAAIESFLTDLESWQKHDTIPAKEFEADKGRLDEFGLARPKLRVKLLGKEGPVEILFGKDAALDGKMYVRLEKSKDVFIAAQSIRNDIAKNPEEFRDKKLTDLTTAQIVRAILKTAAGELELQKKGEQFVADDRGDLHPYGLIEPRGSITLFKDGDSQGQTLQIGSPSEKEKDQVYVRFNVRNAVYTLTKKTEDLLKTKPLDLRDRHLIQLDTNILDRLTIEAPGKGKTILARKDQSWTIASRNNQPTNTGEVNRLLETLRNEQVTKFVEDVASDLAKYGLDKPQLQLTFSSFASENTAETAAGEHPFATLAFGKSDGESVYARLGDEPFIVAVQRTLLGNIFADPLQWQDLAIFKFKPEQVHRFSVVTDKESSLLRGANNEWTSFNSSESINQINVQSLLHTLAALRAMRWVGATTPAHAFEKPQLAMTFTTSPDDKSTHKLFVGGAAGDGVWFARTDEREGTFVMSNSDFNALRLPLLGAPAGPVQSASGLPVSPAALTSPTPQP